MLSNLALQYEAPINPLPEGVRIIAIGDIHGQIDCLSTLQDRLAGYLASAPKAETVVVYLGDYIDRGPDPAGVIERLITHPLPGCRSVFLKGNHEHALLEFLAGRMDYGHWLRWGGDTTLRSYGVSLCSPAAHDAQIDAMRAQLYDALPARHLAFYQSLKLSYAAGDYYFAHAGIRPGVALEAQSPLDLLTIRGEFIDKNQAGGKTVIHGHTIFSAPHVHANAIGIDTGAYMTGNLTAIILEGQGYEFLSTQA